MNTELSPGWGPVRHPNAVEQPDWRDTSGWMRALRQQPTLDASAERVYDESENRALRTTDRQDAGRFPPGEFLSYTPQARDRVVEALNLGKAPAASGTPFPFDIRPYAFQRKILDKLEAERTLHGKYRNLTAFLLKLSFAKRTFLWSYL
jgi:hypothetical protein